MTAIVGTNVAAPIVPFDTADTYATHDSAYGKGGYRSVVDITARNAIPAARLSEGTLVHVQADGRVYRRVGSSWVDADTPIYEDVSASRALAYADNGKVLCMTNEFIVLTLNSNSWPTTLGWNVVIQTKGTTTVDPAGPVLINDDTANIIRDFIWAPVFTIQSTRVEHHFVSP